MNRRNFLLGAFISSTSALLAFKGARWIFFPEITNPHYTKDIRAGFLLKNTPQRSLLKFYNQNRQKEVLEDVYQVYKDNFHKIFRRSSKKMGEPFYYQDKNLREVNLQ